MVEWRVDIRILWHTMFSVPAWIPFERRMISLAGGFILGSYEIIHLAAIGVRGRVGVGWGWRPGRHDVHGAARRRSQSGARPTTNAVSGASSARAHRGTVLARSGARRRGHHARVRASHSRRPAQAPTVRGLRQAWAVPNVPRHRMFINGNSAIRTIQNYEASCSSSSLVSQIYKTCGWYLILVCILLYLRNYPDSGKNHN